MKNYLQNYDKKLLRIIRKIGREADRRGLSAYIVGGAVRDILLKKNNLDLDICVEGDAVPFAKYLAKKWNTQLVTYAQFKTACLNLPGGIRIDLATTRKEGYASSGALPTVRLGNLNDDLFRRDFAINAMAIAINPECFGHLIDKFGGLKDLSLRKIKILHKKSFIDDPTRILRAVRFEQRFNFHIERQTLALIKTALKKGTVSKVKPPRYFSEFKKMLREQDPLKPLKRLHFLGGLRFLEPKLKVNFQKLKRLHVQIQRTNKKSIYKNYNEWWLIYFIELISDANDRVIGNILSKFHFTKNERVSILQSRNCDNIIKSLSVKRLKASQVYQILRPLTKEVILYLRVRTSKTIVGRRIDHYLDSDRNVKLRINGEDLKKMGIVSGRKMGVILEDILLLKIDKRVSTKRDELKSAAVLSHIK